MEVVQPATAGDAAAIAALLATCGLPSHDIGAHLDHFLVARDGERLVGTIGLEVHGAEGLLRSLAVVEDRRGGGIARRLYAALLVHARATGVRRLHLLTTTAEGFFALLGFRPVPRESVPDAIRATEEFRALCPATALCMARVVS